MTKEEVIQGVKDLGLTVSDLFAEDDLRSDETVAAIVEEATARERGYGSRQATKVEKLQQRIADLQAAHETALNEVKAESTRASSRRVLDTIVGERKLDDSQRKFLERNWKSFQSKATDEDGLREELEAFVDAQLDEYRSLASEVYGISADSSGKARGRFPWFGVGNNPLIRD